MNRERSRLFVYIIFMISFMLVVMMGNHTTKANEDQTLVKIGSIFQTENILLKEWSLYAREHLTGLTSEKDIQDYAKELQHKFPEWDWTVKNTSQEWEVTAVSPPNKHHQEMLQLMTAHKNIGNAYIIYKVSGNQWNKESESFFTSNQFTSRLSDIFRNKPVIFSCMKGEVSGRMITALSRQLMSDLHAKKTEALEENSFVSISAFSPMFPGTIGNQKDHMNLQIGIRSEGLGAKTTVVIGTPIITIEY